MRVCRTLKIIRWFKKNLKAGRPEEELTIKQYWLDEESNTKEKKNKAEQERLKYDELQYRFHIVNKKLEHALNTIDELKAENESLKSKLYAIA
jgi:hypothetical protein